MCGRYSITTPPEAMAQLFGSEGPLPNFGPRYNVAPSQTVPIVRKGESGRELAMVYWGLVPSWAKPDWKPLINARGESVHEKPSFRAAFRDRRCLIPADGFYEWQKQDSGPKVPFAISPENGGPFAMAGIWEVREGADGTDFESCAIITTAANNSLRHIHHRMPVVLDPADWPSWLSEGTDQEDELRALLRPAADDFFSAYPISTKVNKVSNDGPELLERVDEPLSTTEPEPIIAPRDKSSNSDQGSLF